MRPPVPYYGGKAGDGGRGRMTELTADQFVQTADGECWARVHTPEAGWQWQRISHEAFAAAAREIDRATREVAAAVRNGGAA